MLLGHQTSITESAHLILKSLVLCEMQTASNCTSDKQLLIIFMCCLFQYTLELQSLGMEVVPFTQYTQVCLDHFENVTAPMKEKLKKMYIVKIR